IQEILVGLSSLLLRQFITEKAVNRLLQLTQGNSSLQARCYQELGDLMVFRGNMTKAREKYEKAVQLGDPGNLAKTTLDELPEQSPGFKNQLNPDELFIQPAAVLNKKGEIFAHFELYKRAVLLYSASIQMDPNNLMSMLNMGAAYYKLGNFARAITILERTLKTHPNHAHMDGHRLLLAQVYAKKGDPGAAMENLKIALKLNPGLEKIIQSDPGFENLRNREDFQKLFQ
ncbi:MAG: tetratricopeptide repeat protein, partial [Nitrospinales bacterium]